MTSPDRSSGPAAGYLPDPLDVWAALESVYWSGQQVAHPWAEALGGLRDAYLGTAAAGLLLSKLRNPATPEDAEGDPRPLVAYDLGRKVEGERPWPFRLTTALTHSVVELPYAEDELGARWKARVIEFGRRAQYALDCLAAGVVPTEAGLEDVPTHAPAVRPPAAPAQFLGGPHGRLLVSTEASIRHAEEALAAVDEMTTDEDTGGPAAVPEFLLPDFGAAVDEAALWFDYLGEWATAAAYVLAVDHRSRLVELFVASVTGGGRRDG